MISTLVSSLYTRYIHVWALVQQGRNVRWPRRRCPRWVTECMFNGTDGRTDGRTDTTPMHRHAVQRKHERLHIGANGVSWPFPWKNGWKIKTRKHAKSSFLCLCYILRAIRAGRCRERRYADHIFIQIYFRMHHFVVKFSEFSSP